MAKSDLLSRLFLPKSPQGGYSVDPGLYHYMKGTDDVFTRFHLRAEPDGRGILLANATAAAHLSPVGVVIAKGLLEEDSEATILNALKHQFSGASQETMIGDIERVAALLAELESPDDNYPIINLEDAEISPFEAKLMAPLLADIQLAPSEILNPLLNKLWNAGIPHVIIHAGEIPQPDYLISAVERSEDLGMITGIRGRATDLDDVSLLTNLATAGLDHLNFLFASSDQEINDALLGAGDYERILPFIAAIQENEIAPVAEVPLLSNNLDTIDETLSVIESAGVRNLNFLAIAAPDEMSESQRTGAMPASSMLQIANFVEETANDSDVRFIWLPPLLRNPSLTINDQLRFGARCSSDVAIFVEPGGDVIPPRGPYRSAGNILYEDWPDIWNDDAFMHFRKRIERPTQCDECPGLAICAADCPKNPKGWSQSPKVSNDE